MLAEAMGADFESAAYKLFNRDSLVKLLHNGKHILAEIGTHTVIGILHNVCSVKVIQELVRELMASRSTYVMKQTAVFAYIILSTFPKEILFTLEKDQTIQKLL